MKQLTAIIILFLLNFIVGQIGSFIYDFVYVDNSVIGDANYFVWDKSLPFMVALLATICYSGNEKAYRSWLMLFFLVFDLLYLIRYEHGVIIDNQYTPRLETIVHLINLVSFVFVFVYVIYNDSKK